MASKTMNTKVLNICKTTEQWAAEASVISKGLLCIEFTTDGKTLAKIGDGINPYSTLAYVADGAFSISDYYTKTEVDSKISEGITALGTIFRIKGVVATTSELPAEGNETGDVWFVGTVQEGSTDSFAEYVWTSNNTWEFLGRVQTEVDLSEYAKITYVDAQVKTATDRLDVIEPKAHTHTNKDVLDATTASYTTEEKGKLEGIEEGANKTTVDSTLSADSTNPVENKAVKAALDTKVTAEDGKGLSSNDFTNEHVASIADHETRLDAIEADYLTSQDTLILNCIL